MYAIWDAFTSQVISELDAGFENGKRLFWMLIPIIWILSDK